MKFHILTPLFFVVFGFGLSLGGCGKEKSAVSATNQTNLPAVSSSAQLSMQPTLPAELAALNIKDGGVCYLDAINNVPISEKPFVVKVGSDLALIGWAVADLKEGKLGSSPAIQLKGEKNFFAAAEMYKRDGLGKALEHPALEGGGFKAEKVILSVPSGQYHLLFLTKSGGDLLRCDTGHTLVVE